MKVWTNSPYGYFQRSWFAWIAVWRSLPFRKLSCLHWQGALRPRVLNLPNSLVASMNGREFSTDSLAKVAFLVAVESFKHRLAENVQAGYIFYVTPKEF